MSNESLCVTESDQALLHSERSKSQPPSKAVKRKAVTNECTAAKVRKKTKAEVVANEGNATSQKLIVDYMRQQNRPYNAQLVFDNLKRAVKKADVERVLDELCQEGKLIMKEVGKMKVYMYSQAEFRQSSCTSEDRTELLKSLAQEVNQMEQSLKEQNATRQRRAGAEAHTSKLKEEIAQVSKQLSERLGVLQGATRVDPHEAHATEVKHAKLHVHWAKQKRICNNMIETLADSMAATTSDLIDELGLDRDEDFIPRDAYLNYN